ncbi:MAG: diaminopimelate decarboxylase [Candidatus Pelagibacter sp.]|nr:diaminopimelate decarboxylase [Candidatus Pelagibacter sp.]
MKYKNGRFFVENVNSNKLINLFGTPLYVYSEKKIIENISRFKKEFKSINPLICFSVKSNANTEILKLISKNGLGADVVSQGELIRALKAGVKPKKIVYSGVGKTRSELKFAISKNILLINAESENEIIEIEKIAKIVKKKIKVGLRLNPDTDANTLKAISTGKKDNKFGINSRKLKEILKNYKNSKYLNFACISVHIGSQITSHKPYEKMLKVLQNSINLINHNFEYIDLGGGMGIKYNKNDKILNYSKYENLINKFLKKNKSKIIFEPGRSIIGSAGIIISRIIYVKQTKNQNFIIMDAAMNDFMRPALYGASHEIIPLVKNGKIIKKKHEFVGPVCETTDKFLTKNNFQNLKQNDYLVICDTGAYGMVLSSNYNLRPIPPEILVSGKMIKIIKKRQKFKDII